MSIKIIEMYKTNVVAAALLCIFFSIFQSCYVVNAQKLIETKGIYIHQPTRIIFPTSLFDGYQRSSIYSFDDENHNVGIHYGKIQNGMETIFSLFLYPAGDDFEERLLYEYEKSFREIEQARRKEIFPDEYIEQQEGEKYVVNGFSAIFTDGDNGLLTVFESGNWFYKIRITTDQPDLRYLVELEEKIREEFDPTLLIDVTLSDKDLDVAYYTKVAYLSQNHLGNTKEGIRQINSRFQMEEGTVSDDFTTLFLIDENIMTSIIFGFNQNNRCIMVSIIPIEESSFLSWQKLFNNKFYKTNDVRWQCEHSEFIVELLEHQVYGQQFFEIYYPKD